MISTIIFILAALVVVTGTALFVRMIEPICDDPEMSDETEQRIMEGAQEL